MPPDEYGERVPRHQASAKRGLDEMVSRTPAARDRYVDFLRAVSILAVVFGHWFIALIVWRRGVIAVYSAVGVTSGLWLATWVFQVIPVFFFVGGFSNATSYDAAMRRGIGTATFLRSRAERLLKPTAIFLGSWLVIELVLHILDRGGTGLVRGVRLRSTLPFGPLWFLAVYLGIVMLSPLTSRLHHRYRLSIPFVLVAIAVLVDVLAFAADVPHIRWVNLAVVWSLAHQLGYLCRWLVTASRAKDPPGHGLPRPRGPGCADQPGGLSEEHAGDRRDVLSPEGQRARFEHEPADPLHRR